MKKTISMILALALCLGLCACGKETSPIVGTWHGGAHSATFTYVFHADGTYTFQTTGLFATSNRGTYTYDEETRVLSLVGENGDEFRRTIELNECYMSLDQVSYGKAYGDRDECPVLDEILGTWYHKTTRDFVLEFYKNGTYQLTTPESAEDGIYIYNPATGIIEIPGANITLKLDQASDVSTLYAPGELSLIFKR